MFSIIFGIALGTFLSLMLAPVLDKMCHDGASLASFPTVLPSPEALQSSTAAPKKPITLENRPHFLSHELGIRNKLLTVTIISSPNDLPLIRQLKQVMTDASESANVPISIVSILAGRQSLIASLEEEIKANFSNFMTLRLSESPENTLHIDPQDAQLNVENAAVNLHMTQLMAETLYKVSEQYRTQFDWFSVGFPQVYIRFSKLFDRLLSMSPTYGRLLMVPRYAELGYNCPIYDVENEDRLQRKIPFKSVLLSNVSFYETITN